MNTVRLWSMLTLLFCVSITSAQAGEDAPSKALLISKLKHEVTDLVNTREMRALSSRPAEVKIDFVIDTNGEIQVRETDAKSKVLDTYIHDQLDDHYYHRSLAGKKFIIKVAFKRSS